MLLPTSQEPSRSNSSNSSYGTSIYNYNIQCKEPNNMNKGIIID